MSANENSKIFSLSSALVFDNYSISSEHCIFLNFQRKHDFFEVYPTGTSPPLKFFVDERDRLNVIDLKKLYSAADNSVPFAQIVLWKWNGCNQRIHKNTLLHGNQQPLATFEKDDWKQSFAIVRFLEKRDNENSIPPLDCIKNDPFTFIIGPPDNQQKFEVSALTLMDLSPVFRKMLTTEMREKNEHEHSIPEGDPEEFRAFFSAISPTRPTLPNPTNVRELLAMACCYQVEALKDRCVAHLVKCVEIPLAERFQLAEFYQLEKLKESLRTLDNLDDWNKLPEFYIANRELLQGEKMKDKSLELPARH